jgi:DMSO/TMAO reductase YedYZ heme-binding membrane subunit
MTRERRVVLAAFVIAIMAATRWALVARPGHALAVWTGGATLVLLLCSLAVSPLSRVVAPAWAIACRAARRTIGIACAIVALGHAALAWSSYLQPLALAPILALPWLRHGALALLILVTLLVTSFPMLQRALRVRAWSALHRLAYFAAIFASLHALGSPFGSTEVGLAACTTTLVLLIARPLTLLVRRRTDLSADDRSTDDRSADDSSAR